VKYAILETQTINDSASVLMHWKRVINANCDTFTSAGGSRESLRRPDDEYFYDDKAEAEKDADKFRAENARRVEQTKRCRGRNKKLPSVIEIVEFPS
jgi:hypothetical protein